MIDIKGYGFYQGLIPTSESNVGSVLFCDNMTRFTILPGHSSIQTKEQSSLRDLMCGSWETRTAAKVKKVPP